MNAHAYLDKVTHDFTPSPSQFDSAKSHRASIESRLDAFLGICEMFETGSLRHGTGVKWYSDADYLVSLKGIRPDSPWTMLDKVKQTLQERFTATTIRVSRPAVVCAFSDGWVEVVPGYPATSGYWIADPTGGWMLTHPKDHNQYVNTVNSKHNGRAKELARQLKMWKYLRSVPISSCYLEMRAAKYLEGEKTYAPLYDLHALLKQLQDASLASMNDPTGLGSRFGACSSDTNKQDALSKLSTAVGRAKKALDYALGDKHVDAVAQLMLLFDQEV